MIREVKTTQDGSKTLYVPELDEHYHSIHGARQESEHVFIHWGLSQCFDRKELTILEVGFGTGLNALLTLLAAPDNIKIDYTGIEPFPLEKSVLLEFSAMFDAISERNYFRQIHEVEWNILQPLREGFSIEKVQVELQNFTSEKSFDLVYFDAFGPRAQAELWELGIFEKMYDLVASGGRLVTYCAKGQVKRNLKTAGFSVEAVPGPPGKREMTIAHKD